MVRQRGRPFEAVPAELVLEVMKNMGVRDLTAFALSSKRLFEIFKGNQAMVMTTVLLRQVELETILLVHTIDKRDFFPNAMLHPRRISVDVGRGPNKHVDLMQCAVGFRDGKLICPRKILFQLQDLHRIWKLVQVVDWWIEEYPRIRWHKHPEDMRCLRPVEELRLRKAISRWWLYSVCFHGKYPQSSWLPKMWQNDDRLHHLRLMSSIEIRQLEDLWTAIRATIQRDVCSSVSAEDLEPAPWGWYDWRSKNIVNTYLKLDPAQLKYVLGNSIRLGKAGIIQMARATQPDFSAKQETLSCSIQLVLQERRFLTYSAVEDIPVSSIIEEDSVSVHKTRFSADGWPNGKPPLTKEDAETISSWPESNKLIPYGDDGRDLDY